MASTFRSSAAWNREAREQLSEGDNQNSISRLVRESGNFLQRAAGERLKTDAKNVEAMLKFQLQQTGSMKKLLQTTLAEMAHEMKLCLELQSKMQHRLSSAQSKSCINDTRMQTRTQRPDRESTVDDVHRVLLWQQGHQRAFEDKLTRALKQMSGLLRRMDEMSVSLQADFDNKVAAECADMVALSIPSGGTTLQPLFPTRSPQGSLPSLVTSNLQLSSLRGHPGWLPSLRGGSSPKGEAEVKMPHQWARKTEESVKRSQTLLVEAARLRKAISLLIHDCRVKEHSLARELNAGMKHHLAACQTLVMEMQNKIQEVQEEKAKALQARASLVQQLENTRAPLKQAKERLAARRTRPREESVADAADAALANEVANLNTITAQLSTKIQAVDSDIARLNEAAKQLEANVKDKSIGLAVDEQVAKLDGRITLACTPPSTVISGVSQFSTAKSQTMRKIADLEVELSTAQRERETMEEEFKEVRIRSKGLGPLSPSKIGAQGVAPLA